MLRFKKRVILLAMLVILLVIAGKVLDFDFNLVVAPNIVGVTQVTGDVIVRCEKGIKILNLQSCTNPFDPTN